MTVCSIIFYTFDLSPLYSGRSNVPLKYSVGEPVSNDQGSGSHPIDTLFKQETKTAKAAAKNTVVVADDIPHLASLSGSIRPVQGRSDS